MITVCYNIVPRPRVPLLQGATHVSLGFCHCCESAALLLAPFTLDAVASSDAEDGELAAGVEPAQLGTNTGALGLNTKAGAFGLSVLDAARAAAAAGSYCEGAGIRSACICIGWM